MSIGARLREERQRLGLSQPALAENGGVLKQAQLNYEKDERVPDARYLAGVAAAGVDVLYVITGQRAGVSSLRDGEATLIEGYRALDARGKAGVMALISGMAPAGMNAQSNGGHVIQGSSNVVIGTTSPAPIRRRTKSMEK